MKRSVSSSGASSLSSWSCDGVKSLSKSSNVGEGGGDGDGGGGSRGGKIPCFRRASLLKTIVSCFLKKKINSQFCIFVGIYSHGNGYSPCPQYCRAVTGLKLSSTRSLSTISSYWPNLSKPLFVGSGCLLHFHCDLSRYTMPSTSKANINELVPRQYQEEILVRAKKGWCNSSISEQNNSMFCMF